MQQFLFLTSKVADGGMGFITTPHARVAKNRKHFVKTHGINLENVVSLKQIHGSIIRVVTAKDRGKGASTYTTALEGDALVTNTPRVFLSVVAADCNQIALFDPKQKALALIHAGRRGLEKEIVKKTVFIMRKEFTSDPKNIVAKFGPSICPQCYFKNIWDEAEKQLIETEVLLTNIDNPKLCTFENEIYFSHRRFVIKNLPTDERFWTIAGLL